MTTFSPLTEEEKARILQALREDQAFREEIRHLLLDEVQASIRELRESIDRLATVVQDGFENLHQLIRELTQQVQENSRQIAANGRQIAALTEHVDELTQQVQENSRQIEANSRQIAALTERVDELIQQVQENSRQIEANGRQIAALTERMDELTRQVQENSRQIEANGRQIAALTERVDELTRQVQENSRQIAALTERMERVEVQIAALTERMERVEAQIAALTGEVREQRIRLDDVSGVAAEAGAYEEIAIWLQSRGVEIARKYLPGDLQDRLAVDSIPDGVMLLRYDSGYVFLVYEVTFTIALRDVRRIAEWLEGFHRVKWPAIGLVYYRRALPEEDDTRYISENGREVIQTVPGMRTLREEAVRGGVLLMQHGASPWRPKDWQPPEGLEEIPQVLISTSNRL